MIELILGFDQISMIELNVTFQEIIILDWLNRKSANRNECYFFHYKDVIEELPILKVKHDNNLGTIFRGLLTKNILQKVDSKDSKGKRISGYSFNSEVYQYLCDHKKENVMKLIEPPENAKKKIKIDPKVQRIFERLFLITKQGSDAPLFHEFSFDSPYNYVGKIQTKILDMYQGRFSHNYPFGDEQVLKADKEKIEKAKQMIRQGKGNFDKIEKLILQAARNFSFYFSPSYSPLSKSWLERYRNIDTWMYNENRRYSLFMIALAGKPELIGVELAEYTKEKMPVDVREIADITLKELFPNVNKEDETKFWYAVNSCLKMERILRDKFHDYMTQLILGEDGHYLKKYLMWLPECFGEETKKMIRIAHINGRAWDDYFNMQDGWGLDVEGFDIEDMRKIMKGMK